MATKTDYRVFTSEILYENMKRDIDAIMAEIPKSELGIPTPTKAQRDVYNAIINEYHAEQMIIAKATTFDRVWDMDRKEWKVTAGDHTWYEPMKLWLYRQ